MMSKPTQNDPAQMFAQILQQLPGGFVPSESDGGIIEWFPTETVRPMESLDDGGIIPGVTGDFNAYLTFEDYDASKTVDYNPFVTVDYLF
jgi:hypothetical protein